MTPRTKLLAASAEKISDLLSRADIRINGSRPWDIKVMNPLFFHRVLTQGSLGLGESYMDGWWDCAALDECICRILKQDLAHEVGWSLRALPHIAQTLLHNPQTLQGSKKVAEQHYDLGNDFYVGMLDPSMQYSCGYFKNTEDLAVAQRQKMDLLCKKLLLKKGGTLLDIGCGWGGLAKFAVEKYDVNVTGVNISEQQIAFARDLCRHIPVQILECDYRLVEGTFDKAVSVGMFEHVGPWNYRTFMETIREHLKEDGLFVLHTIGQTKSIPWSDPWITRYIFPNSHLPSLRQIAAACEGLFVIEDVHNFGAYYDLTLLAWHQNFERHWYRFRERYGERFYRMWRYYLLSCAGAFRARSLQLWQVVLSPTGVSGGYSSHR